MDRLKNISSIGTLELNSKLKFIPSWEIKEKDKFTETARRYIGKLLINEKEYLCYYISSKKEHVYIKQLIFDIKKSLNYENLIIFVDNYDVISKKYNYFSFGKTNTYIIKNNYESKELIKKYYLLNMHDVVEEMYENEILISNWDIADYMLEDNIYILTMPFINTETLEKLNWFFEENSSIKKKIEIITLEDNVEKIKEIIKINCNIRIFDKNFMLGGNIEMENFIQEN